MDQHPLSIICQMAGGFCLSRCLHVVADLGVADALDGAPRTAEVLADAVGAHPDALRRVLRLLAAHGVFECDGETFRHSPASLLLRSDHPQSLRALARMFGLPYIWATSGALEHAIRMGLPVGEKIHDKGFWDYLADDSHAGGVFNAAMTAKAHGQVAGVVSAFDFSGFRRIADIGGGRGHLLRAVLDANPSLTGILFDLPHVVSEARDVSERWTVQGGDFFRDQLPCCDAYTIMEVIHDWADAESIEILRSIRRAAAPNATLLLIEQLIPDDNGPHWAKTLDIHMMALFGGRQRTRIEYETLLTQAGFSLRREIDTGAGVTILEAGLA